MKAWYFSAGFRPCSFYRRRAALGQPGQRFDGAIQKFADLSAGLAAFVARQPLRRVGQHELVTLFDGVTALGEISRHSLALAVRARMR